MKTRPDAVFISAVLFTAAFLLLIPSSLSDAWAAYDRKGLAELTAPFRALAKVMGDRGTAALVILCIGLVVTWTGYLKRLRWTWLVMFIIVWGWAFPLMILQDLILPIFHHAFFFPSGLSSIIQWPGRRMLWQVVVFLMMLIALVLPIKSFFRSDETL